MILELGKPQSATKPEEFLSFMFRRIAIEMGVKTEGRWTELMNAYLDKLPDGTPSGRTGIRANLTYELLQSEITWKTFLKGLEILQATELGMSLVVRTADSGEYYGPHHVYLNQ